jgi:hypothetical protein
MKYNPGSNHDYNKFNSINYRYILNFTKMKTISGIFIALTVLFFTACEGVPGPPGMDGKDGEDGTSLLGSVFERVGDFTSDNNYELLFEFPDNIEVYESDIVLVYILWEQVTDNNGDPIDVWRLLPQTVVLDEGVLQYNFDYTFADVKIFLEGTVDLSTLLPAEAENQIFRIVIMPADFVEDINVSDYDTVMKSLKLNPGPVSPAF